MASSGENMSSSMFICRTKECHKVFTKFCILKVDICISPVHVIQTKRNSKFSGEIFETFVAFDDDLTMENESYSKYLNLA